MKDKYRKYIFIFDLNTETKLKEYLGKEKYIIENIGLASGNNILFQNAVLGIPDQIKIYFTEHIFIKQNMIIFILQMKP